MTAAPDTIVAVATPSGRGGVGIVRLSGPRSKEIAEGIFQSGGSPLPWRPREMIYGRVVGGNQETVDDGFAVWMPAPHSYTGEEVVEFQTHGSPVVLQEIVSLCRSYGARLAEPGEFTKRAFLNGRIDLVQAEAVAELIASESESEAQSARRRLEGVLSRELGSLREEMTALLAECEADIDFPEENLPLTARGTALDKLVKIQALGETIRKTYDANQRLKTGFSVALVGRPNVGKSALFNALLNMDRAIVTAIPGTTRDVLREELILSGRRVRLIDTAGVHSRAADEVEKLGIERAEQEVKRADLICLVAAADEGVTAEDRRFLSSLPKEKVWWVWNKIDLARPKEARLPRSFEISATRGDGVAELREAFGKSATEQTAVSSDGGIGNDRQKELIDTFLRAIRNGEAEWRKGASPEFAAFEFRQAHRALSRLVGKDEGVEEILDEIFSRFCIGK